MLEGSELSETWALCFVANHFIGPMYRAIEAEADITRPEFVVLLCVNQFDGLVAQDVADMSGLPRNTVSRGVNRLISNGYLCRAPAGGGIRDKVLRLTADGLTLYGRLRKHPERRRVAMLREITEPERRTLNRLLLKLAHSTERWAVDAPTAAEAPAAKLR